MWLYMLYGAQEVYSNPRTDRTVGKCWKPAVCSSTLGVACPKFVQFPIQPRVSFAFVHVNHLASDLEQLKLDFCLESNEHGKLQILSLALKQSSTCFCKVWSPILVGSLRFLVNMQNDQPAFGLHPTSTQKYNHRTNINLGYLCAHPSWISQCTSLIPSNPHRSIQTLGQCSMAESSTNIHKINSTQNKSR